MKITIKDNTCGYGNTNGSYGYSEIAVIENGEIVDGSYTTTADFGYCQNCGRFEQNIERHQSDWNCNEYRPSYTMIEIVMSHLEGSAIQHYGDITVEIE